MTLKEISYNILNLIRGGRSSNDEIVSLSQIEFNILHYRAMLIRRDYARNGIVTRHLEQSLGCLKLQPVDLNTCCSIWDNPGVNAKECTIKRTQRPIPKTVRFNFEEAISFVGEINGITHMQLISPEMARYTKYSRYTDKKPKAFILDDHIYVMNTEGLEFITARGIFEDPRDLRTYERCAGAAGQLYNDGTGELNVELYDESFTSVFADQAGIQPHHIMDKCYNEEEDFPMPMDMIQTITQGLTSGELQLLMGAPNDTTIDRHTGEPGRGIPRPAQASVKDEGQQ